MNLGEALEHGDEAAMLSLSRLYVDYVVVEVVFPGIRSDRQELGPRLVNKHGAKASDL
jgi:hypothetical protein